MCKAKYGSLSNIKMQRTFLQIIFTLYRISHKGWDFRDDFILFHTFLFSTILIFFLATLLIENYTIIFTVETHVLW